MSTGNPIRDDIAAALGSDYEILRELGRGGASVVYLARDRVLGREVAVKVVRDGQTTDAEAIARFEREARTLAALQHPNIVMLYSARQLAGGTLALVMQHGDWSTLKSLIRDQGPLPIDAVVQILGDVATALVYLHRNRVIHRDIKPENIFIEAGSGRALISDFGIARTAGEARTNVTLTGVVIGTPAYMSPEQIDGGDVTGRSDLYSLGMVGYEMLTGVRPWEGENLFGVIYKQKTEQLPPLLEARPDVPAALNHLIERATEKDPARRWADAVEFLAHLNGTADRQESRSWAEAVVATPAAAPLPVPVQNPADHATLQIDQAALISAIEGEHRLQPASRPRRRPGRFMTAAVVILLLTGGAGALAFSARETVGEAIDLGGRAAAGGEGTTFTSPSITLPPTDAEPPPAIEAAEETPATGASLASAAPAPSGSGPLPAAQPVTPPRPTPQPATAAPTVSRPVAQAPAAAAAPASTAPQQNQETTFPYSPPALLPALSVTRVTGTEPRISGGQVLQPQAGTRADAANAPQLLNRDRIQQLLAERYPNDLRARGIGGTTVLTVLVAPDGRVEQSSVVSSSGNERLDEAAAAIAGRMLFEHPAGAAGQSIWISVPLAFSAR